MVKCIKDLEGLCSKYVLEEIYQVRDQDYEGITLYDGSISEMFTYEEMKKCFITLSVEEEFELLKQASQPMIEYLNKFCNPMTTAVITEGFVKIMTEEMGLPLETRD